jgi:hypothetical protein
MGKKFEEQKRLFVKGVSLLSAGKQESWRMKGERIAGLPDFSWYKIPKREEIYQIITNYTKCP